jgi:hypothetical protein
VNAYTRWFRGQWDRALGWGCVAAGAILVLSGAAMVSSADTVLDQLSYLASSVAVGLFLLGVGAVLILVADSRDEWSKLDQIANALGQDAGAAEPTPVRELAVTDGHQPLALRSAALPPLVLAGLGMVGGAGGVREAVSEASALRWMQIVALSLLLAVFGVALTQLRARRSMAQRFQTLAVALSPAPAAATAAVAADGAAWVVSGSQLFHRAGCDLLRFSSADAVPVADAERQGLAPCRVCR